MATLPHRDVRYYEYIVLGCGGIGSGALYWLSKRVGSNVLGIEQFRIGHDNGGSQDHSRIIRLMYHDQKYTRLTPATYTAWDEVERESGIQVVYKVGSMNLARKGTQWETFLEEHATAMSKENIPFERLTGPQIRARFPQWTVPDDMLALYQADGGLVDAAMGIAVHVQLARSHGATTVENCKVLRIEPETGGTALVHTTQGMFRCRRLVITAGSWIAPVMSTLGVNLPMTVTQEQVTYYATPNLKQFTKDKFPVYIFHDDANDFYGLPIHGNSGAKIGIDAGGPVVTADTRGYMPDPVREQTCTNFLRTYLPEAVGPILYTKTCLYDMPPDRDFIIDTLAHKGAPQIAVCCGGAHGYKFASLLGRIMSEIAVDGRTKHDISSFGIQRPALTDPSYKLALGMGRNATQAKL